MFRVLQIPAFHVPGFTDSGFSCSGFYRLRLFVFRVLQIPSFRVPGFTDSGFSCSGFYRFRLFMFRVLQIPAFHVPGFLVPCSVPRSVPRSVPPFPAPCFTDSRSFRNSKYKHATELSKFVWHLKDKNIKYSVKWRIIAKCSSYSTKTKRCQLCLHKKFLIIYHPNLASLNSRNELLSKCRHRNKFLLSNKQLINSNVI